MKKRIRISRGPRAAADPASETIQFSGSYAPSLEPGEYTLTAQLTVSGTTQSNGDINATYSATQSLIVYGSRYAFDPSCIVAQYPAPKATGLLAGLLPGIVLSIPTLPWTFAPGDTSAPPNSRLGIIVIADGDTGAPIPVTQSLQDVLATAKPTYFPVAVAEKGEDTQLPVRTIDLPTQLYGQTAPLLSDLPYLAQVREVSLTDGTSQLQALVLGPRIVAASGGYTAYLVSLDSYSSALPVSDGQLPVTDAAGNTLADYTAFRFVVLNQWSYTNTGGDVNFSGLATNLNEKFTTTPALEWPPQQSGSEPIAYETIENILALGYVPLPHSLRQGSQTVSFYRGPLVPVPLGVDESVSPQKIENPDAVLAYDPATGTFDARLSAAWQLGLSLSATNGRLLAAAQTLATAQIQNAAIAAERAALAAHLGVESLSRGRGEIKGEIARLLTAQMARILTHRKESQS